MRRPALSLLSLVLLAPALLAGCPDAAECEVDADCLEGQICREVPEREALACIRAAPVGSDAGPGDVDAVAIDSFIVSVSAVPRAGSATLSWVTQNATSCALDQGIGGVPTQGEHEVFPTGNTAYTLSCQGPSGPAIARAFVAIVVEVVSFTLSVSEANAGAEVTASWQTAGATSCLVSHPAGTASVPAVDLDAGSATFAASESGEVSISCQGADGPAEDSEPILVARVGSLTADPAAAAAGDEVTLSWEAENVTACAMNDVAGPFEGDEVTLTVSASTTFTLVCEGYDGPIEATVQVLVLILELTAAEESVASGEGTTLSFSVAPEVSACTVNGAAATLEESFATGPLTQSTDFTLRCERPDGLSAEATVTVLVSS